MFKKYILIAILLISTSGFSKGPKNKRIQLEGFTLKTDLLPMINNIISSGSKSGSFSGELYFNDEYSFNIDLSVEAESQKGLSRRERRFGSHIRWYLKQEDCNCSAFFIGCYFSMVKFHQSVDQLYFSNSVHSAVSYNKSSFEGGMNAGYQFLLNKHFVIDPSVQMGMEFNRKIYNKESMNDISTGVNKGILIRISFGVGYRFW